jgi:glycosyltransferase involved in cell wall biosynthesis
MVIHHGVDAERFCIDDSVEKENQILSVVNDWINRDWCCGFGIWQNVTKGLPVKVLGDTPGLSKPAGSLKELVRAYQSSRVFLNTSTLSPIPTVLLEAMACGCAVVSTATCMIPEIIEHGVNGFISNEESELKEFLATLLNDESLAQKMGERARETVLKQFAEEKFIQEWNMIFHSVSKVPYIGRFK